VFDPSQANARNPPIQMYFYAFLVRQTLTRRQNGLVALRANGWEQVAQKGSHIPLSTQWKLGASTGVVTNREERKASRRFKRCECNRGPRLTGDAPLDDRVGVAFFNLEQSTSERSESHQQKPGGPPTADCGRSPRRGARDEP
jgi:hypothetical protein